MAEFQAYSCDAITGAVIDRVPFSAFAYSRMLSAGDSGSSIAVPIDGTLTKTELRHLFQHLSRMIVLERDGVVEYMGRVQTRGYARGASFLQIGLSDIWTWLARRGGWDHSVANVEKWSTTETGNLAAQAAAAIVRGRDIGPVLPAMGLPLTLPGGGAGPSVTRKYFGYHLDTVGDVIADLLDEGLDIYFKPRWITSGDADWLYQAGQGWNSGVTREFYVTAEQSDVVAFSESSDAARVTNNARYIGEGSEQDMLVRSERNTASPYPLMDRITQAKNVSNVAQLSALAAQDLSIYGDPTFQWSFQVSGDSPVDVGDKVRLHFDGDPWIADGWHERRVVNVAASIPGPDVKTISVQATGGA
ncbi:hypothetical protein [Microbacterium sp. NPDC087592]|uniref:hypothetical protein n=1 Tax=Microbacterium sp. NPDC087592 TaxID=3364193 RepID=UPI0037F38F4C